MARGINKRPYDIVVWGATGFTGKLVAEYLGKNYPKLKWAVGGRNESKLRNVLSTLSLQKDVIVADIGDDASMDSMCSKATVVLSTAGPFAKIGTPVVAACVRSGTNYVDITGEGQWYREVIDKFHDEAKRKNLRIIPCCGFDCVPPDLGCMMMVNALKAKGATSVDEVRLVVSSVKGGASGGTIASVINIFETSSFAQLLALANPYMLNPRVSPENPNSDIQKPPCDAKYHSKAADFASVDYDPRVVRTHSKIFPQHSRKVTGWMAPWIMQAINTRVVNRSNALSGWTHAGPKVVYSERMMLPWLYGVVFAFVVQPLMTVVFLVPFLRAIAKRLVPQSGDGPTVESEAKAHFRAMLWATGTKEQAGGADGKVEAYGKISIKGDAGYRKTATMIAECALSVALDGDKLPTAEHCYGVVTPSVGIGSHLLARYDACTAEGIEFRVVEE